MGNERSSGAMNSIQNRAEEIVLREMIYGEDVR